MFMIRKAEKKYPCIVCNKDIEIDDDYIRPLFTGLDRTLVYRLGNKMTWADRRPYFHVECFVVLRRWFNSTVPVINYKRQELNIWIKGQTVHISIK